MGSSTVTLTVGADPEGFLVLDGDFVSAHGIVPGSKQAPYKLDKGAVQLDGTAFEFNIDPAETAQEFSSNIMTVLGQIRKMIPNKYKMAFVPSVEFKPHIFKEIPDSCKELGCNPDFNAYTGTMNPSPDTSKFPYLRTGAGHIHVGWTEGQDKKDESHLWDCQYLVKMMDSNYTQYQPYWDADKKRTNLYGKVGAYRPTTFGVEYRVPSNAWVKYPSLHEDMFKLAKLSFEHCAGESHTWWEPRTYNLKEMTL